MKHLDEYRQREAAEGLLEKIHELSRTPANIMEICGTHTHAISRFGIRGRLPSNLRLISGPGCPVCVTSASDVNAVIDFCRKNPDVIVATFGDMLKVPGSRSTLQEEKARGADVRVVYSPMGVVDLALRNPEKEVMLFAVGFETTAPAVASTIVMADLKKLKNLSFLTLHKLTPPAMRALVSEGEIRLDGFICPGHVTAVIGAESYGFLSSEFKNPCVVAGFEPVDVLMGLYMLVCQIEEGRTDIEIEYDRVVTMEGNRKARDMLETVFEPCDSSWRGIGVIPESGLAIRNGYARFDAEKRFDIPRGPEEDPPGCSCGDVLKGLKTPPECKLFTTACTPSAPVGPCMVSSEGTCAAYYKFRDMD